MSFRPYDRSQQLLLPPYLCGWDPEDDLAHFIVEAVERVDIGVLAARLQEEGVAAFVKSWKDLMACIESKSAAIRKVA